jgi:hypothetical protein
MQGAPDATALIGYGAIFTLFFITLAPLKILGPFAQLTKETDEATMRKIAVRAFVLAVIAVVAGGFAGRTLHRRGARRAAGCARDRHDPPRVARARGAVAQTEWSSGT